MINLLTITTKGMRERIFYSPIHEVVGDLARIAANETAIAYLNWVLEDHGGNDVRS